ncbi:MAG: primosomal protein N', partial [Clostridia bacterium]|nr:primosomal protein N' [Clostridia bacterium]
TPQTVGIFSRVYGERIAVIHSGLSAGERFDEWRRIREGKVDVCIGTRSAIFAPFPNLGLVVMDEEQEHTYKSDQNPKYHARDVARFRCATHGALMLLASATPSLESFHRAQTGRYTLVRLTERYGEARLPEVVLADLRADAKAGDDSIMGSVLRAELEKNLREGEQSILFVNRRGYNNFLSCNMCGSVRLCPHCSVSLTYHAKGRYRALEGESIPASRARNGYLTCHYCGYREAVPASCPECGNKVLQFMGFGTQLAENYLQDNYPDARVLRMDADTTQNKFSYDEILGDFRETGADVLLGTQMVTKGHDFPDVTLVGVLSVDSALYLDDYRANERAFSLVTQVVGRAGRAEKAGRAVIQTYSPDHALLRRAAEQDYDGFYRDEIALRRALVFPPFCDMVLFSFSASGEETVLSGSTRFAERMKECLSKEEWQGIDLQAFGPFESPIYKKQDRYHMRLVIKCIANAKTRSLFAHLLRSYSADNKKLNIQIDINPTNL